MRTLAPVAFFAALSVAACAASAGASSDPSAARVLTVKGEARARSAGAAEWKTLAKNDAVPEGSEVATGAESFCELGFFEAGKSAVRLQADSRAVFVSANPVRVNLLSGRVFSLVRELKKGSEFQVSTPTAIASARGTGWEQSSDRLSVFEDTVHLSTSAGQTEDVPSGRGFRIGPDGTLGEGFALTDEEMAAWEAFRRAAARRLDDAFSSDTLSQIDQNDPVQDILQNKDAFDDLNDQDALEKDKDKSQDGGGGFQGGNTVGTGG
ncbi:MAG TPA: FecR domain-containing protein [Candidatus Eisenbacteria bacterium]|nr:FecR domain-containing protein [Candidatus Eisenbacteria bacterium]